METLQPVIKATGTNQEEFKGHALYDRIEQNELILKYPIRQSPSPLQDRNSDMSPLRRISPACMTTPIRTMGLEDIREEDNEDDIQQLPHNPPPCTTFTSLPSHTTPPPIHKVVRNPFDAALIKRLHLPIYSPNVFKRVVSPSQENRQFCWTIDDMAKIRPAPIEEYQIQQYEQPFDPETESRAQEAIDHYFCNTYIGSSPWGPQPASETSPVPEEVNESYAHDKQLPSLTSSDDGQDAIPRDDNSAKRNVSTQTMLSLPLQLPRALEAALKPYFTFTQEQCDGTEEINLSTSTLRRKLFDQEDSPQMSLSPVRTSCFSMQVECKVNSPQHRELLLAQSQVLCPSIAGRTYGTPLPGSACVSSPEISPISTFTAVHQRNKSATRLNFSRQLLALDRSSRSPSASPLGTGLMPIHHEDDHYSVQMPTECMQENDRKSSSGSSNCMITSGTYTPVEEDSESHSSSSEMITSGATTPVKKIVSFSGDVSMERTHFNELKTKFKEFENSNNITVGEGFNSFYMNSTSEIGGINLHNHDTGYQTGSISCNMTNLHSGATSSAFSTMSSVSRTWSSIHFNSVGEKHVNEGFYGDKCNFAVKSTSLMMEDNSVWLPSSKHIISSTPTKSNNN